MCHTIRCRVIIALSLIVAVAFGTEGASGGWAGEEPSVEATVVVRETIAAAVRSSPPAVEVPGRRFLPSGLSLLRPYAPGKIPVVLIHGFWATPLIWVKTIEGLEADPALREHYQFWTFGYATGAPIPDSAYLLRTELRDAGRRLAPGGSDPAFGRMVLIGHSLGGLLAKMMAQESGSRLWELVSTQPLEKLTGPREDCERLSGAFVFKPLPEVRRVVCIATPHRGVQLDREVVHSLGVRLIRLPSRTQGIHASLLAQNGADFFTPLFRAGPEMSVDQLIWDHPLLRNLSALEIDRTVNLHSIIADLHDPPRTNGSDGVVACASARLDGVRSEQLVFAGHLCHDHPAVIQELRRILFEHLAEPTRAEISPSLTTIRPTLDPP